MGQDELARSPPAPAEPLGGQLDNPYGRVEYAYGAAGQQPVPPAQVVHAGYRPGPPAVPGHGASDRVELEVPERRLAGPGAYRIGTAYRAAAQPGEQVVLDGDVEQEPAADGTGHPGQGPVQVRQMVQDAHDDGRVEGVRAERQRVEVRPHQEGAPGRHVGTELDGRVAQVGRRAVDDHVVPGPVPVVHGVAPVPAAEVGQPVRRTQQPDEPPQRALLGPPLVVAPVPVGAVVVLVRVVVRDRLHHVAPLPSDPMAGRRPRARKG